MKPQAIKYPALIKPFLFVMALWMLFYCSPFRRMVEDSFYNDDVSLSKNLGKAPKMNHKGYKEERYSHKLEQSVSNPSVIVPPSFALHLSTLHTFIYVPHYLAAENRTNTTTCLSSVRLQV